MGSGSLQVGSRSAVRSAGCGVCHRTGAVASWGRGVEPLGRPRGMCVSLKVFKSCLGVRLNSRYARANHCVDCVLLHVVRLTPDQGCVSVRRQIGLTHSALLPGGVYVSSFSLRRHSHVAGRGLSSRRHDRFSVLIASAFSGDESAASAALAANAHFRNGHRVRRHVCGRAGVAAGRRRAGRRARRGRERVERGARRFFRQGSARASAWAAACGSAWSLRPTPGRTCSWAAFEASRSGDIFIYVVPRGCRP
jgi:hypothetical protein